MKAQKLKRVYIKEEFVAITEDPMQAILIDQLLELADDTGWTDLSAEELAKECLLNISRQTIRKNIAELVKKGFVIERRKKDWSDHTLQYHVDMNVVIKAVHEKGLTVEGYRLR